MRVEAAPAVAEAFGSRRGGEFERPGVTEVRYNPTADMLFAPVAGPLGVNERESVGVTKNFWTGHVEKDSMDEVAFDAQYHTFERMGYAAEPSAPRFSPSSSSLSLSSFAGDRERALRSGGATVLDINSSENGGERKRKRKASGRPDSSSYLGPWAPFEDEESDEETPEEKEERERDEEEMRKERERKEKETKERNEKAEAMAEEREGESELPPCKEEKSVFHGKERFDYQGRTYMSPPSGLKVRDHECYVPKKKIHTWKGHSKAVTAIRFLPRTGHLLLSSSMDGKAKLWDVYNKRRVLRTFLGHSKGIRDIAFNNDGSRFLTASYDKYAKLWDTESGECLGRYSNGQVPYCVQFNPLDNGEFLAGCHDKKILQWDTRVQPSGQVVQEYDRHLGAVNSITFLGTDNARFMSTSDDKSIRVWEYGIPVDIKLVSEPHMHAVPAVTRAPDGKHVACQSLDNQVLIYSAGDSKFKINKNKRFTGHFVSSFACKPGYSPDGKYIISGDANGDFFVWDYRSGDIYKKLKAHNDVCIAVEWHPVEPSKVATCGWDGDIHFWD